MPGQRGFIGIKQLYTDEDRNFEYNPDLALKIAFLDTL